MTQKIVKADPVVVLDEETSPEPEAPTRRVVKADPVVVLEDVTSSEPETQLEGEKDEDDVLQHGFVEFRDRIIEVRAPNLEQMAIVRRTQRTLTDAAKLKTLTGEQAIDLMDNALIAICTVVIKREDVRFIEQLWGKREMRLKETLPLLTAAIKALDYANEDNMNREERRAAERKSSPGTGKARLVTG